MIPALIARKVDQKAILASQNDHCRRYSIWFIPPDRLFAVPQRRNAGAAAYAVFPQSLPQFRWLSEFRTIVE